MSRPKVSAAEARLAMSAQPAKRIQRPAPQVQDYPRFDLLDGRHPWQQAIPESYLLYPVRQLKDCKVAYFNFTLAREMGLIDSKHPDTMSEALEAKILETFAIQIINEYDQLHPKRIAGDTVKTHPYMATRYLQLQHANKRGRTSGDGRSIWNGSVTHRGTTWDVSSRGTGVTALAPGAVEAKRPLKSGSEDFGYGCGMADIDELISSAIMSETLHRSGVPTERMLAILDVGKNLAIGVRAAPNLIRPAHLFLHLKQHNLQALKQAADYLIERQTANRAWNFAARSPRKYDLMAEAICSTYARFVATLEREYIFMWLDWDGDNCLADAGIIDYGSIRVFGLRHDQYRYDDVDRYSTNLNEQKHKARMIVQVFIQIAEYLKTGKRNSLTQFKKHPLLKQFDTIYEETLSTRLLEQIGFHSGQVTKLMKEHLELVKRFEKLFAGFETAKTRKRREKLPDGINRPAIFNMRHFLREAPRQLSLKATVPESHELEDYFELMHAENITQREARFTAERRLRLRQLLECYMAMAEAVSTPRTLRKTLLQIATNAQNTCREQRMTGNSVEHVVGKLLSSRRRGMSYADLQTVIDALINHQTQGKPQATPFEYSEDLPSSRLSPRGRLFREILHLVHVFREDI